MKATFIIGILSLFPLLSLGQLPTHASQITPSTHDLSNLQRYGLDYELIDYTFVNGDSSLLEEINIIDMISARDYSDDVEMANIQFDVRILIYSEIRSRQERGLSIEFDPSSKTSEP